MRNPNPAARRAMWREHRRLRKMIGRLRRREGSLALHAEQRGPFARQAEALAAALGCILIDHLGPAVDALEREAVSEEPLPEPEEDERK